MLSREDVWRRSFLRVILLLGATVLGFFAWINRGNSVEIVFWIEALVSIMMWLTFVFSYTRMSLLKLAILGWIGLMVVMTMLMLTGGIERTGLIWWGLMPSVAFVMFGKKGGLYSVSSIMIMQLFFVWQALYAKADFASQFSVVEMRQAIILTLVVTVIMYSYEKMIENVKKALSDQAVALSKEVEERRVTQKDLEKAVDAFEIQEKEQSNTRKAMLNLLEDARDLETALKLEKSNVEKKVEARTEELKAVINSVARGLMVVNKQREVVLVNDNILSLLGKAGANYLNLCQFLHEVVNLDERVESVFRSHTENVVKAVLVGNHYFDIQIVVVKSRTKHFEEVAIFVKDVTEAVSLQRSRDEFFSIASHELRTPLTAIRGNSEMIIDNYQDKIKDKDIMEMLTDIHDGSIRLIEIVNDFLNVSRLEMGKLEFKLEEVDLLKVVSEVIKDFDVPAAAQKLKLELVTSGKIPRVIADRDRLKQVLINLIGNAFKFTKQGGVSIELGQVGEMVEIRVSDTGEGIAPEQQGLLFHKFQQAGSSLYTRDTSKGTGLGLYISKLMMEGMRGGIELSRSEVGVGSTFALSLHIFKKDKKGV